MLFVGDDWAEDHHDVELQDERGKRLAKARLEEGIAGISRLHELIGRHAEADKDFDRAEVVIGIETDRGLWVQALIAAGYQVYAINPLQVARYRETVSTSGAKSDAADARTLADMVREKRDQLRPIAGDSAAAEAIKVVARAHKTLIWERNRHTLRLRHALREFFPAALVAFGDLAGADALELLGKAPDPASAARLTITQITLALQRARRHHAFDKAEKIRAALRSEQLAQPAVVAAAFAAMVRAQVAILTALNEQIKALQEEVEAHFGEHSDAEIYLSQPGLGVILGARVLSEFGDDSTRYGDARARKNYAGTSPVTRRSGKKKVVLARFVHNDRLIDALGRQAFAAMLCSPGARAFYDQQRARGVGHHAALRQLANRLVGILHGCLKTGSKYDEATAWAHRTVQAAP
ncbi:IS110 family transposase [Nonomuraea sp. NPDC003707]